MRWTDLKICPLLEAVPLRQLCDIDSGLRRGGCRNLASRLISESFASLPVQIWDACSPLHVPTSKMQLGCHDTLAASQQSGRLTDIDSHPPVVQPFGQHVENSLNISGG
ncbi:hypothetical protein EVAR_38061_1 [Eumeta japonica]|uniref:Uncharacterized protein n=1 Tax=Eumeta variegata TaxID=151549 RepID=A0A4C1WAX2_EUMVA|nr:hypothetical protein EVAR_38061_1 [Eumeta japonica]